MERFSRNRSFRSRDFRNTEKHKAICDECKKECEVPFKPNGKKPVLCNECYRKNRQF
jgi:CxxC-x17-CxxC domain-containing protein